MKRSPFSGHPWTSFFVSSTTRSALPLRAATSLGVNAIYAEHANFVWLMLQRLGVRTADLEDALQEVFVVVHRRLGSYDPAAKVTSWLFGITIKVAARFRRRAHVRREHSVEEVPEQPDGRAMALDPEQAALAGEARRRLVLALDALDAKKRVVFVMFEIDAMSCREIAEELDLPIGTVHSRLHAARREFSAAAERERARQERNER